MRTVWVLTHTWYDDIVEVHKTKEKAVESMNEYISYNPEMTPDEFRITETDIMN